jgi:sortase A
MGASRRVGPSLWIERALLALGVVCLAYYGYVKVEAHRVQREYAAAWAPGVVAVIEMPRLNVAAVAMSGEGADVLDVAVGHLPDTPAPWESGNSVFAAHRDGLFRPLKGVRRGDELRVRTPHGDFVYRVRETKIVKPSDLSVVAQTPTDTLTLITCYPFTYVGNAPKRFVVHAERVPSTSASVDLSMKPERR